MTDNTRHMDDGPSCPLPTDRRRRVGPVDWPLRLAELAAHSRNARLRAFYRQVPPAGETPMGRVPLLALDIETSGLDMDRDDILSIGCVAFQIQRIRCRQAAHWIVRPNVPLEEITATIHGITHSDLAAAPYMDERFDDLLQAMAGRVIVAHCGEIERRFLSRASMRITGEALHFPLIDTMSIATEAHAHNHGGWLRRWLTKRRRPSLRLDACRTRYGLPAYRPHHALTDALATAELFQAQMQYHFNPQTPIAEIWQ